MMDALGASMQEELIARSFNVGISLIRICNV